MQQLAAGDCMQQLAVELLGRPAQEWISQHYFAPGSVSVSDPAAALAAAFAAAAAAGQDCTAQFAT